MSTFVLVHGAWHGGWCWHKIVARLEADGHTVVAPDMPGHGTDRTPIETVTMVDIVGRIHETIDAANEPVILVGHSYGGAMITQTAEQRVDRIRASSMCGVPSRRRTDCYEPRRAGQRNPPDRPRSCSPDGDTATADPRVIREASTRVAATKTSRSRACCWCPRPSPDATLMQTTANNFGRVPRDYVECTEGPRHLDRRPEADVYRTALPPRVHARHRSFALLLRAGRADRNALASSVALGRGARLL